MRCFRYCIVVLAIVLTLVPHAGHAAGGGSDGGTDALVETFVVRARYLLDHASIISDADHALLEKVLRDSEIVAVDLLRDPQTNRPIMNQESLAAYGSSGLIQLKKKSFEDDQSISWQKLIESDAPTAHIIFHELYRASGVVGRSKKSPDDSFAISVGQYRLNTFRFPVPAQAVAKKKSKNPLEDMDLVELSNLRDKCITVSMRIMAAQIRAQAEIISSSSFMAGFSRDSASRLIEAMADGQITVSEERADKAVSICKFVNKEYDRRLAE